MTGGKVEIFLLLAVGAAAKYTTDSVRGWLARRDQEAQDDMAAHEATVQEIAAGNYPGSTEKKKETGPKGAGSNASAGKEKHRTLPDQNSSGAAQKGDGKKERKNAAKAARKAAREEARARKNAAREEARSRSSAGRAGAPGRSGGAGRAPIGADSKGPGKGGLGKGGGAGAPGKGAAGGSGAGAPAGKDTAAKDKAARQAGKDKAAKNEADRQAGKDAAHADRLARRKERARKAGNHAGRAGRKALDAHRDRKNRKKAKKDAADRAKTNKDTTTGPADPTGPGGTFAGDRAKHAKTRAGTRTGRAVQSARAYGEGFLQGFRDALDQAAREHAAAQAQQALDETRKPMAKEAAPATPVPVTGEDSKTGLLTLGKGAARKTISRGEVKTLKNFTDRLGEYASTAGSAAEDCKELSGRAQEYAAQANALAEQCRAVKGGEGLVGECLALAEAATVQGGAADELHARMLRAVESLEATSANAATRHGAIFQAVADSPLSSPAESRFYNS
ncbi:hypothetical protein ACFYXP_38250 [Streptomyces sp. NPDC002466]|uniref:hypothetical protein n=1 Tax=Streptomyces sp. NPDC002466 TaxID=3364646 RepID=UPI0036CBF85D